MSMVSDLKVKVKKWAIIGGCLLLALVGYRIWTKHAKKVDSAISSPILQPDQKSKVIIDPVKHTITTVTKNPDGTTKTDTKYLGDSPTSITEGKDGKITVTSRVWGPEKRLYLGIGGSLDGTPKVNLGADLFYYKRLDIGTGLDFNPTKLKDTRLSVNISYNFWSNTSIALSIDNHQVPGLSLKVRF